MHLTDRARMEWTKWTEWTEFCQLAETIVSNCPKCKLSNENYNQLQNVHLIETDLGSSVSEVMENLLRLSSFVPASAQEPFQYN